MYYNLAFNYCGLAVLLVILVILHKIYGINSYNTRLFRNFIIIAMISAVLDITTAYTIVYVSFIPPWLNLILNTIYCYLQNLSTFLGVYYVFKTAKLGSKIYYYFIHAVLSSYILLLVVNLFTGILFDFKGHVYNKGILYYYTFIVSFLLLIILGTTLIIKRKLFSKKQHLLFGSFVSLPFFSWYSNFLIPII